MCFMNKILLGFILLISVALLAQQSELLLVGTGGAPAAAPGPFNYTLFDWGQCSNGSAPTPTCAGNSTYPPLPSGAWFSVNNPNSLLTTSNTVNYKWPTFTLAGGSWPDSFFPCFSLYNTGHC